MSKALQPVICLIEDDAIMGDSLLDRFDLEGFRVDWHRTGLGAMRAISNKNYDLIISDIHLPDINGEEVFTRLSDENRHLPPFIFITGFGSIDLAVRLLKRGAADYISKPFDLDILVEKIRLLCPEQLCDVPDEIIGPDTLGISPAMREIEQSIPRLSQLASAILITGESGAGKEHVAQLIHRHARLDRNAPFVAINCGAVTESLLESELFGHEKGSFTGAAKARKGVFEQAHGGTLFLDEIGDMPLSMQTRLLRVLQERQVTPLGGGRAVDVDFTLICATHRKLREDADAGVFRSDLYYRINGLTVNLPALRERSDFQALTERLLAYLNPQREIYLAPDLLAQLSRHSWPGNLRQYSSVLRTASAMLESDENCIDWPHLSDDMVEELSAMPQQPARTITHSTVQNLKELSRAAIQQALENSHGNISAAARQLGISRQTLYRKLND